MMKNIWSITIVVLILFGCLENRDKQFEDTARELKSLLLELQNVRVTEDTKQTDGQVTITLNFDNRAVFIKERKVTFERIADRLKDFATKNLYSRWSDDAAFLRVIEYISISLPGNDIHSEAVRSIKFFLDRYPTFTIEKWTRNYFSDITLFNLFNKNKISFDFLPYSDLVKLPESERIRAFLEFHIVYEYLKGDDIGSAEKEYERIRNTGKYRFLDETLRSVIDEYKKKQRTE